MHGPKTCARSSLLRWSVWFFFLNAILASSILLGYLPFFSELHQVYRTTFGSTAFGYVYFIIAFFSQMTLFMLGGMLLCFFLSWIAPFRGLVFFVGSFIAAIFFGMLCADLVVFRLYHMHYLLVGLQIFKSGTFNEVLTLDIKEWLALVISLSLLITVELLLAYGVWRFIQKRHWQAWPALVVTIVGVLLVYLSFGLAVADEFWSSGYRYAILRIGRVVPYLSQIYSGFFRAGSATQIISIAGQKIQVVTGDKGGPLQYPSQPLQLKPLTKKMNIVLIGIDTWRYSALSQSLTPNIYAFEQKAIQFQQHFSSGNCTQPGLFGLFYGISPTYWKAFLRNKQGPTLIDALLKQHYKIGVFLSAPVNFPKLNDTVFVKLKKLQHRTEGDSSLARDAMITNEFLNFLQKTPSNKPFFSFLFYDALHNYCESVRPKHNPYQPAVTSCNRFSLDSHSDPKPYLNLYYNKTQYVDRLVGNVLDALKKQHRLQNTIVIITADHGEEMNDDAHGIWGHASAYNEYQLHVPMIVYWPGMSPQVVHYQTTHYDVAPTLVQSVLGNTSPVLTYSSGQSLFASDQMPYFVAGSYGDYAVLTSKKVFRIYPDGDFSLSDRQGNWSPSLKFNLSVLKQAETALLRYFNRS